MADSRDLNRALKASRLRLSPIEEEYVLNALTNIEKNISACIAEEKNSAEAREPYEFS